VLLRVFSLGPLAACALLAACDSPASTSGTSTGGPPASATATASAPTATAQASASTAPLPSTDPEPVHTVAVSASAPPVDAGPPRDAGAKPPRPVLSARPDAGAADAGAVAASDAGAAPVSPALAIARQVDAIFAAKKTFTARFTQQYTLQGQGIVKDSTGVIFIERPSKISFRYDPPNQQRIVSDGTTLKMYMPADSQMYVIPAKNTEYPGALAFMMGNGIATSFDFAINEKAKYGGVVLDGKPLTPTVGYELVMFYINKDLLAKADPGAIERVLVRDAQGNKNRFDFKGSSQPATIDPAEFTFTPPPGTTLVNR
jgi:outer membrane lipoprotein carrier protein